MNDFHQKIKNIKLQDENELVVEGVDGIKQKITEDVFRDCLTKPMGELILTDKDPKVRESINTVEGIQGMILKVQGVISKKCPNLVPELIENKDDVFYGKSKNQNAQNSYVIAKDFMRQNNYKMAVESFQMALKEDPNFVLGWKPLHILI